MRTKQTHMEEAIAHAALHNDAAATADAAATSSASSTSTSASASGRSAVFSSDRSREFRAILETQRRIHKQLGDAPSSAATAAAVSSIIAPVQPLTPFTDSASHLSTSIRRLAEFLSSQRAEYLDLHRHLSSSAPGRKGKALSNVDRDRLEEEVSAQIRVINSKIDELKSSITSPPQSQLADADDAEEEDPSSLAAAARAAATNPDLRAHQHTVIILLLDSLRAVAATMASLKAQRTAQMRAEMEERHPGALALHATHQREREQRRAGSSTAAASAASGSALSASSAAHIDSTSAAAAAAAASAVEMLPAVLGKAVGKIQSRIGVGVGGGKDAATAGSKGATAAEAKYGGSKDSALPLDDDSTAALPPTLVLSAHEQSQLLTENHHLLDSLEDNLDAMKRAETSMAAIANLMSLFQTKVLQQEEQIETIYSAAIQSTLHVHSGIGQLKQAIQRGVTFRMMILFMILVLSFSLLFLDWYIS